MGEQRDERKLLLQQIDQYSFAVDDVKLFLDTPLQCPAQKSPAGLYPALRRAVYGYRQRRPVGLGRYPLALGRSVLRNVSI